jgi:hypothetical protein
MTRTKPKPQKQPRGLTTPASLEEDPLNSPSRRTRSQLSHNGDPSPSSAIAQSVSCAGGAHSDEDNQDYDNNDGKDEDSDNDNSDDKNNSESKYALCDDQESDANNSKCDSHHYSKFINSLLLEDEEPPESYCVDWAKGKGAGRKANKGRPPRPDTTLMTADEAEEATRKWEKDWKRDRDKLHRKNHRGPTVDGCSFIDGTTGYTGCISRKFQPMVEVTIAPLLERHTFPDKEIVLMRIVEEANL